MKELFGKRPEQKKAPLDERERELLRAECIKKVEERKHFIEESIYKAQRLKQEKKEGKKDKKQNSTT